MKQVNDHTVEYDDADEYERDMGHRPRKRLLVTTRTVEHPTHGTINTPLFVRFKGKLR